LAIGLCEVTSAATCRAVSRSSTTDTSGTSANGRSVVGAVKQGRVYLWRGIERLIAILVSAGILLGGLEVGLRAFPAELIPVGWLKRFQSDLRLQIAERLSLPNDNQMWQLPRDDGGPPLELYLPHAHTEQRVGPEERSDVTYDAQGFCNPPRDRYGRATIDVIIIGDAFTDCVAAVAEASWISRLGQRTGLSVYNLGRGGIGPYDYLQIFKYFGLPKKPSIALMNIYEGNDLRDSFRYHQYVKSGQDDDYASAADHFEPELDYQNLLDNPLGRHSYLVNLGLVAIGKAYEGIRNVVATAIGDRPEAIDFRYQLHFLDGAVVPFNIDNADQSEARYAGWLLRGEVQLSAFDQALEQFAALGRAHHFQPAISYAPSAYTAYASFVEFEDDTLRVLMPWSSGRQRDYLRQKAASLGIVFVDLTPALQAAAGRLQEKELLYYPAGVHLTPAGHRVVADALAVALTELQNRKMSARDGTSRDGVRPKGNP
jgi:hypothetical protein